VDPLLLAVTAETVRVMEMEMEVAVVMAVVTEGFQGATQASHLLGTTEVPQWQHCCQFDYRWC